MDLSDQASYDVTLFDPTADEGFEERFNKEIPLNVQVGTENHNFMFIVFVFLKSLEMLILLIFVLKFIQMMILHFLKNVQLMKKIFQN